MQLRISSFARGLVWGQDVPDVVQLTSLALWRMSASQVREVVKPDGYLQTVTRRVCFLCRRRQSPSWLPLDVEEYEVVALERPDSASPPAVLAVCDQIQALVARRTPFQRAVWQARIVEGRTCVALHVQPRGTLHVGWHRSHGL